MRVKKLKLNEWLERHHNKVKFIVETSKFYEYKVFTRSVYLYKDADRKPSCTCQHGSCYGVSKPDELCKHIKLVRKAIIKHNSFIWNWWDKENI